MSSDSRMKYGLSYTLITGFTGFLSRTILHFRKTEIDYMVEYVKKISNKNVLDYGCNTGYLLKMMSEKSPNNTYFGADINPHALNTAKRRNPEFTFFSISEASKYPEKFDVVILSHVLEHVLGGKKMLNDISALLKKDGTLIIAIPQERIRGDATIFQYLYNVLRFRFKNPHVIKYDYDGLEKLLKSVGFVISEFTYTHYLFPFKSQKRRPDSWSLVTVCKK